MILKVMNWVFCIILIISCDSPRKKRISSPGSDDQNQITKNLNNSGIHTGDSSKAITDAASNIPDFISHCQWSKDGVNGYMSFHKHFDINEQNSNNGGFTVCQSRNSELEIYFQLKTPINDSQICLFPLHHQAQKSIYIGEPRCLRVYDNKKIYKITMIKNRPGGYSQFPLNGVMIMKDKSYFYPAPFYQYALSPDAYIFCSQFLDQYQNPSYCQAFKMLGKYVLHRF